MQSYCLQPLLTCTELPYHILALIVACDIYQRHRRRDAPVLGPCRLTIQIQTNETMHETVVILGNRFHSSTFEYKRYSRPVLKQLCFLYSLLSFNSFDILFFENTTSAFVFVTKWHVTIAMAWGAERSRAYP